MEYPESSKAVMIENFTQDKLSNATRNNCLIVGKVAGLLLPLTTTTTFALGKLLKHASPRLAQTRKDLEDSRNVEKNQLHLSISMIMVHKCERQKRPKNWKDGSVARKN